MVVVVVDKFVHAAQLVGVVELALLILDVHGRGVVLVHAENLAVRKPRIVPTRSARSQVSDLGGVRGPHVPFEIHIGQAAPLIVVIPLSHDVESGDILDLERQAVDFVGRRQAVVKADETLVGAVLDIPRGLGHGQVHGLVREIGL